MRTMLVFSFFALALAFPSASANHDYWCDGGAVQHLGPACHPIPHPTEIDERVDDAERLVDYVLYTVWQQADWQLQYAFCVLQNPTTYQTACTVP